jgi:hypothetical protein
LKEVGKTFVPKLEDRVGLMKKLVRSNSNYFGGKSLAYDGRKTLLSYGSLPFENITLSDKE